MPKAKPRNYEYEQYELDYYAEQLCTTRYFNSLETARNTIMHVADEHHSNIEQAGEYLLKKFKEIEEETNI